MRKILIVALAFGIGGPVIAKPDSKVLEQGKNEYVACVACHGPDGKGVKTGPLVMGPSLPDSEMVKGDVEALALIVLKGIKKEDATYVQQMLALQDAFDDKRLAAVLTYVRHTFGGQNDTVSEKDVAKWRKQFSKIPPSIRRKEVDGLLIRAHGARRLLSDMSWKEYKGSWSKLPDFTKLEPSASGKLDNSLIHIGVSKLKDNVGLVFEGTLKLPADDTYEFATASDDGSDLWIGGKRVVDNDGIHGVVTKRNKVKLKAGEHALRVRWFEKSGGEDLMVSVKAKSLGGEISLSKKKLSGGGGSVAASIPLEPDNFGEAVLYRNFIAGSSPRGIAVGYPGGLNICWDADINNLAMLWRGDFMDAGRHRRGRGQGSQPPSGQDVTKVAEGPPLMVIASPEQVWPNGPHKVSYMSGKDTAERKDKRDFIAQYPGYRFKGYRLDEKRFPTFQYAFESLEVTDGFAPEGTSNPAMVRTLAFSGSAPSDTFFRVARDAQVEGDVILAASIKIKVTGAKVTVRNNEALIPVKSGSTIRIAYMWDAPVDADL